MVCWGSPKYRSYSTSHSLSYKAATFPSNVQLLRWNSDAVSSMKPVSNLDIVWLVLRRDETVSDEEIDNDHTAVWFEFAIMQGLDDLRDSPKLLVSSASCERISTYRERFHFIVMWLWFDVLGGV